MKFFCGMSEQFRSGVIIGIIVGVLAVAAAIAFATLVIGRRFRSS